MISSVNSTAYSSLPSKTVSLEIDPGDALYLIFVDKPTVSDNTNVLDKVTVEIRDGANNPIHDVESVSVDVIGYSQSEAPVLLDGTKLVMSSTTTGFGPPSQRQTQHNVFTELLYHQQALFEQDLVDSYPILF